MNVTLEELEKCKKRLRIEIPADVVTEEMDRMTTTYCSSARVPGFRQGRAPRALVSKKFAAQIKEECQEKLLSKSVFSAIREKGLRLACSPRIADLKFEPGMTMAIVAEFETYPDFSLPNYKGLEVTAFEKEATEEEIEEVRKRVRRNSAKIVDVEDRALEHDDLAVINFTGSCEDKPIAEAIPEAQNLSQRDGLWIKVGDAGFLPGFGEQLIGLRPGEKKEVVIDLPADFTVPHLAGKKLVFQVDLQKIKREELPPWDDDLAIKQGVESAAKLEELIRQDLSSHKENKGLEDQRNQILDRLVESLQIDIPEAVVQSRTRQVLLEFLEQGQQMGIPQEQILSDKEKFFQDASSTAQKRTKADMLLARIAEEEKIGVTDDEMEQRLREMSVRYRMELPKLRKTLEKNGNIDSVREMILFGKAMDFIFSQAKIVPA